MVTFSQLPSVQNYPSAKVAYLRMAHSDPLQILAQDQDQARGKGGESVLTGKTKGMSQRQEMQSVSQC